MSAPARLERTVFEISRAVDFFTLAALRTQTGVSEDLWAAMCLKELVDNALDATEATGIAPEIGITLERDSGDLRLTISDNGPGLPPELVGRMLNFETRTSTNVRRRAPTRGALGNALKTIVGLPYALGSEAPIIIESLGVRHEIRVGLTFLDEVEPRHVQTAQPTAIGTSVTVTIPAHGQHLDASEWGRRFSLVNPHTSFLVNTRSFGATGGHVQPELWSPEETAESYNALVPWPPQNAKSWRKWLPSDPTSCLWYGEQEFADLIRAEVGTAQRGGHPALPLGAFVRQFEGLTSSQKARDIAATLAGIERLSDFERYRGTVATLLAAMQAAARPVKAERLGLIGEAAIRRRVDAWYGVRRFWYRRELGMASGIPFAVEAALAETDVPGGITHAINFSPTYEDPLARVRLSGGAVSGYGVKGFLHSAHVPMALHQIADDSGLDDVPKDATVLLHIVCPALRFVEAGKSEIDPQWDLATAIGDALWRVSKTIYAEAEERRNDAKRAARREARQRQAAAKAERAENWPLCEACYLVIPEAVGTVSDNGRLPYSAHRLYYVVRKLVQLYTSARLKAKYFEHTVLVDYQKAYGRLPGLYREPRGTLYHPFGGNPLPLGTLEVEQYRFPHWLFNKILVCEKAAHWPLIRAAGLAEKYDMAVLCGEGFATEAARVLLERAEHHDHQITAYCLHDADPSGYGIARILREPTPRMPDYSANVMDLGLSFEDGLARGLETERFERTARIDEAVWETLTEREKAAFRGRRLRKKDGAAKKERDGKRLDDNDWVYEAERIELDALPPAAFIAYIEERLVEHGATEKIVPPVERIRVQWHDRMEAMLAERVRDEAERQQRIDEIVETALRRLATDDDAELTAEDIRGDLEHEHDIRWTDAVDRRADEHAEAMAEAIAEAVELVIAEVMT